MKRFLIMVLCAIVGVAVLVTGFTAIFGSSKNIALRAIDGAIDGLANRDEADYIYNVLSGGSVSANVKTTVEGTEVRASGKLYLELEDYSLMFDELSLSAKMGEEKINITGSVFADQDRFYVKNDDILGGAYGIEMGTLADGFKKSVFAPDSGSAMALDEATYEIVLALLELTESDIPEQISEDALDFIDDYTTKARKLLFKHAEYNKNNEDVKIGDDEVSARVVSVIITPETISNFLEDFYDYLKSDKDLRDFIVKSYSDLKPVTETLTLVSGKAAINADLDVGELYDEAIESLGEQIDSIVDSMKDADEGFIAVRLATPKSSAKLMKAWVVAGEKIEDIEDDPEELMELGSIDFGKDGAEKTDAITISVSGQKIKYTVTEEDDVVTYKLSAGDTTLSLALDEENESYTAKMTSKTTTWGETVTHTSVISGDYVTDGDATTLTLEKVKVDGTDLLTDENKIDLSITIEESDGMPKAESEIKSILTMKEEDFTKIMEKAMEKLPFLGGSEDVEQMPNVDGFVDNFIGDYIPEF